MQSKNIIFKKLGDKYSDKKFILIQRISGACGIFSHIVTAFNWIKFAMNNNYIPVVNIKSNCYFKNTNENIWEYAFKQPSNFSVNDVLDAQNVFIASNIIGHPNYPYTSQTKFEIDSTFAKNNIIINDIIKSNINQFFSNYKDKNIVGVLARGTDYRNLKPKNHFVQPSIEQICNEIQMYIDKYNCQKIFLVTEDKIIANELKKIFADKIIDQNIYIDYIDNKLIRNSIAKLGYDIFKKLNIQYITNIFILSKLDYLICSITSATMFLNLIKESKKNTFFNLGRYK